MADTVREADLRALLDVVAAGEQPDPGAGLPVAVLEQAHRLIGCDLVSFTEFNPAQRTTGVDQNYPTPPPMPDWVADAFWQHYWASDCSYPDRTGNDRAVLRASDFYPPGKLRQSPMYIDFCRPLGIEHEIMVCLPASPGWNRRVLFSRSHGPDFDDRDLLLLALLRPHLCELHGRLDRQRRGLTQLTQRQQELLQLVAAGYTNKQIARRLVVSPSTVRKHLENIFSRLEVTTRTAAAARAYSASPDRHGG